MTLNVADNDNTLAEVYILDWRGWLPGSSAQAPGLSTEANPTAADIPAMLRRRLTPVGRALCSMLCELDVARHNIPIIHASQHGDGQRPLDMLDAIAAGDPVSPARFSLSVHNALVGVYSIASNHQGSIAAIAAGGDEWAALLSEARGYLAEGWHQVALVWSDSTVPARYRAAERSAEAPSALALTLSLDASPTARPVSSFSARPSNAVRDQPEYLVHQLMTS
ncbi:beta-ketoacyl synthase chain length factor [Larsenimonas rhizosphaerae]|uniref:Beta-ketoacyl synthase chain length factor n=1 Tax=Larsenimonas rhizosphaerae TaxID=2944682 RepID=A0AA42CYA1_9GAMM|nr:beta-ketoacyl synthase chain length factor [Larsenimonas rhizosphaerae]MCM2131740.1 beta-ketoacyl synthase chain length factor [Larsenimonas rhizosphaerae]MCX2524933.1 beta-ketoacyl synthase chain length factor [Larsenimonas rhizosphaerae]